MLIRLALISFILLTACNPLQPPKSDPPQLPEKYAAPAESTEQRPDRWWQSFNDPQLDQLQEQMLSGNLDLRQSLYRLDQLDALRRTSGAGLWPSLSANASAGRDRTPSAAGESTSSSYRGSLAASYEIDLWNRLHDKEQAAEFRRQAGEKEAESLLLSLTAQLAENYFSAGEQRAQIALLQQQIERNEKLLATATDRYRAGLASAEEIYQAQVSLVALQAQLPQLQTALVRSEQALALLLGRFSGEEVTTTATLPEPGTAGDNSLPASLLQQRPDISAAFLQLQAADHELAAALADKLPGISLSASLGRSVTRLSSGDIEGTFWSLAASLVQPLIDGGRRQAAVDQQQALRQQQATQMQQLLIKAVQDVETALVAERNSLLRYRQLQQQQHISQQTLELNQANYRSGLTSSSDLLNSELQQLNIRSQLISSQAGWLSSRISLARALGGSWMAEERKKQQNHLSAKEDK
ncbi:efflux transporter, outer membrane factor (OMF) lipoprotein, NodT family [Malonomonas rubra DSM 5091]|uniref:Efflux transporter, outer membrane factor (OMF) lipoprotein, NodT family n=1 Tax=Malonomonas rubra DSM 5091 TaxID=1122189 RepID=A0A1M6I174_MALRU|nr:efflux transporter outer membrane subunit [Malonomonas rubra]SHJ28150.1 efflux transporter, outer membrane factor (OMF) lipoprotein, NodT family [Malonomonas rubra DSM 5091]